MVHLAPRLDLYLLREGPSQYGPPRRSLSAGPPPDSPERKDELDSIEALGDEIAILVAQIHAATHRLLALIADFDGRRGWELDGHRTCAHWLAIRTRTGCTISGAS